ncbi:MAG: hypothetical protein ACR2QM_10835, partial [Longimicrobiales bacterium]
MQSVRVLVIAFAFAACSSSTDDGGPVASASIAPADTVITMPTMFTGQGLDASGTPNTSAVVTWTSLNGSTIAVDQMGLVTPVTTGIGQVQIEVEGFTATSTVRSVFNPGSSNGLFVLFPFTTTSGSRQLGSDISQADADSRTTHADNVWTHLEGVLPSNGGPNTGLFYTATRELWTHALPFCGGTDEPTLDAVTSCYNSFPQHFLVATDDNGPTTKALAQQFLRFSYADAEAFPWLKEGWPGWIASGSFDSLGEITISAPRQVVVDNFDAADSGGTLVAALPDLLTANAATFYAGSPIPVAHMNAQAALFWGWLVTENSGAAIAIFQELATNGSSL